MKKLILIILVSILAISCEEKVESNKDLNTSKEEVEKEKVESNSNKISKGEFSNPAFMMGSDFLGFFKSLKQVGDISGLVSFTSSKTIKDFGVKNLEDFYKKSFTNMSKSKLKGMTEVNDSTFLMHYINSQFATKRTFDIKVKIENDSTKIVLDNLNSKYPFK